ncbi:UNKNOWN [Stylonychia lemnae]|uniref:Alpha-2-macroglobulin domain-containing protein n=1 Tax=Stylonychia lemnae TaxID=5949 RepID=A0A078AS63_STYLE|nr:UNKNOWN [Stylonychia lemnae]|eukprot:CDW83728.1 UNKNOWN [Stylonychia lemnae]
MQRQHIIGNLLLVLLFLLHLLVNSNCYFVVHHNEDQNLQDYDEFTDLSYQDSIVSNQLKSQLYEQSANQQPKFRLQESEMVSFINKYIYDSTSALINISTERFQTSITTDKTVYKPLDIMFAQVYVSNAFSKQPIMLKNILTSNYSVKFYLYAPDESLLYQSSDLIQNSTSHFTYKFPNNSLGGEYKLVVTGQKIQNNSISVILEDFSKQQLNINCKLGSDKYYPGDNITGELFLSRINGKSLSSIPTFSYSIKFSNQSKVTFIDQQMGFDGTGYFSFQIPKNATNQTIYYIFFIVRYQNQFQGSVCDLQMAQPSQLTIDFYPENGIMVANFSNTIYFQSFLDINRQNETNIDKTSLIARDIKTKVETTILDQTIQTSLNGMGSFRFVPQSNFDYFLQVDLGGYSGPLRKQLVFRYGMKFDTAGEIIFKIQNRNKVFNNIDTIQVLFQTNNNMNSSDVYILYIKQKEKVVYYEDLSFQKNQNKTLNISTDHFVQSNGGIFSISLLRVSTAFQNYFKSRSTTKLLPIPSVEQWTVQKGESLIYILPSQRLKIQVNTNKEAYTIGELVQYNITVIDTFTGQVIRNIDSYVTVIVSDMQSIKDSRDPTIASQQYLLSEIQTTSNILSKNRDYLDLHFRDDQNSDISLEQTYNENLDTLMAVQGWRYNIFSLQNMTALSRLQNATTLEKENIQKLFSYNIYPIPRNTSGSTLAGRVSSSSARSSTGNKPTNFYISKQTQSLDNMIQFAQNSRIYTHYLRKGYSQSKLEDQTETLQFINSMKAENGIFKGSFYLSDKQTQFRLKINAFDQTGRIGYQEIFINTQDVLEIITDMPEFYFIKGDKIRTYVSLINRSNQTLQITMNVTYDQNCFNITPNVLKFQITSQTKVNSQISISAISGCQKKLITFNVTGKASTKNPQVFNQVLTIERDIIDDEFQQQETSTGFINFTGTQSQAKLAVNQTKAYDQIIIKLFPTNSAYLSSQTARLESRCQLLQECVAPSLILSGLSLKDSQSMNITQNETQRQQLAQLIFKFQRSLSESASLINQNMSTNFEEQINLLIGLSEVQNLSFSFNSQKFQALQKAILSSRVSNTGFSNQLLIKRQAMVGSYFQNISNAYIVLALVNSGLKNNFTNEIALLQKIVDSQITTTKVVYSDSYLLSLISNIYYAINNQAQGLKYADILKQRQLTTGSLTANLTTFYLAQGTNQALETTCLSVKAWLNNYYRYQTNIQKAIQWILSQQEFHSMENLMTSVQCSSVINQFIQINEFNYSAGEAQISLTGSESKSQKYQFSNSSLFPFELTIDNPVLSEIKFDLQKVQNNKTVLINKKNQTTSENISMLYEVTLKTKIFNQNHNFQNQISDFIVTTENMDKIGTNYFDGSTILYYITVKNKKSYPLGNIIVNIRVPSCLEPNLNILDGLVNEKKIDYYQIFDKGSSIFLKIPHIAGTETFYQFIGFNQIYMGECGHASHELRILSNPEGNSNTYTLNK